VSASRLKWFGTGFLHDNGHRLEIVAPDLLVREAAIPLSGRDPGVTEEILDRGKLRLSIEHVSGHRVTQVMTGDREAGLPGVVFHAFLDPADRERMATVGAFFGRFGESKRRREMRPEGTLGAHLRP
jgi:hypothetical protein